MFDYIISLQEKNYVVNYTTGSDGRISMIFFCREDAILKARRMPESIMIDTTYKLTRTS